MSLWGDHTRAVVNIDGQYHFYDSASSLGIAHCLQVNSYSDVDNKTFKSAAHYFFYFKNPSTLNSNIDSPIPNKVEPARSDFQTLWDIPTECENSETTNNTKSDFQTLFDCIATRKSKLVDNKKLDRGKYLL